LLDIFERSAEALPASERDAKWRAFNRVADKIGVPAKSQGKPRTVSTLRASQKRTSL